MFNDENQIAFKKMQEFSTVDGFVEVTECLAEMIKYVVNEPSVGLFYVQQHIQNAAPNLINLKNNVVQKSHEMTLHAEDSEDSISAITFMKECGFLVADDMIRDIKSSLTIISNKHPKQGFINSSGSAFQLGRTNSWGRNSSSPLQDSEKSSGYLSSVIMSAKFKGSSLKWNQTETSNESFEEKDEVSVSDINASSLNACVSTSNMLDAEVVELPISSQISEEQQQVQVDEACAMRTYFPWHMKTKNLRQIKQQNWRNGSGR